MSWLPDSRNQAVTDVLGKGLIAFQFFLQRLVFHCRTNHGENSNQQAGDESPPRAKQQGHSQRLQAGAQVAGVAYEVLRPGGTDLMTTIGLDANGR